MIFEQNKDFNSSREHALSIRALLAAGRFDEAQVILGWLVDSKNFRISLPQQRAAEITQRIEEIIKK